MRLGDVSGVRGCGAGDCAGRRRGRGGQALLLLLLLLLLLRSLDVAAEARVLSKDERQTSTLPALSLLPPAPRFLADNTKWNGYASASPSIRPASYAYDIRSCV